MGGLDIFLQELPGIRTRVSADVFGGAFSDNLAAGIAALRSQVDDPICHFDDVQVMFDDKYGVAAFCQALQDFYQLVYVSGVQAHGRFIQNIESAARRAFGKLTR